MENNKKKCILIVDDTPTNIQVLVPILNKFGDYDILVANNGRQALEVMRKTKPELVLLDVMMPELNGYETCEIMKSDDDLKDVPVIFLTAKSDIEDLVEAFNVGGSDYITKPFNATELMSRVKTHLKLKNSYDLIKSHLQSVVETEEELRNKISQMESDLERALVVQKMLLPNQSVSHEHFDVTYRYLPMEVVGGDYICFPRAYQDEQGFIIGDLSGHGVSAALYMTLIKFVTDNLYPSCAYDPKELLEKLNSRLFGQMPSSFFTAIYGVLILNEDTDYHTCTLAGAAHPMPIVYDSISKSYEFIELTSSAGIGILPTLTTENVTLKLKNGSRLYLYTDGVTETHNIEGEDLGKERFLEIVKQSYKDSIEDTLDCIMMKIDEFRGTPKLTDDLTILAIKIR